MDFCGEEMVLTPSRALYWPRERALLVADLHLEKASFYAGHGQLLPPYDSRETLERLALTIRATGARKVVTLGDNFHDPAGASRLDPHVAGMLAALTRAVEWVWIAGNHDMAKEGDSDARLPPDIGGTSTPELEIGGLLLRHQAKPGDLSGERAGRRIKGELSGHFHPRVRITVHHRHIRRPCAVVSLDDGAGGGGRMILPAFGALTGGMDAGDPAIRAAMQPASRIDAVLPAKGRLVRFPLWRGASGQQGQSREPIIRATH